MTATVTELCISERFRGPPGTANGGVACGSLAVALGATAEVTLRRPLPLGRPLAVRRDGAGTILVEDRGVPLAEARTAAGVELAAPGAVTRSEALAAAGRARYYDDPVFPGCFVCGPAREPGDGLRILPGPAGGSLWAAPWTPDPSVTGSDGMVRPEMVWAALDCPGGIAAGEAAGLPPDRALLLGRMTASLGTPPPRAGDDCRVVAWLAGRDGRKLTAGSALLGPGGEVLAAARAVWLAVPRPGPAAAGRPA